MQPLRARLLPPIPTGLPNRVALTTRQTELYEGDEPENGIAGLAAVIVFGLLP
jgi:hypothetical protein